MSSHLHTRLYLTQVIQLMSLTYNNNKVKHRLVSYWTIRLFIKQQHQDYNGSCFTNSLFKTLFFHSASFFFFFTLSASEVFNNSVTLISRGGDAPRVHHVSLSADWRRSRQELRAKCSTSGWNPRVHPQDRCIQVQRVGGSREQPEVRGLIGYTMEKEHCSRFGLWRSFL